MSGHDDSWSFNRLRGQLPDPKAARRVGGPTWVPRSRPLNFPVDDRGRARWAGLGVRGRCGGLPATTGRVAAPEPIGADLGIRQEKWALLPDGYP